MSAEERRKLGRVARTAPERQADQTVKLERDLHKLIQNELTRRGIYYVHSRTDQKTTQAIGVPDFIFAINGKAIAIEVKLPGNTLSDGQRAAKAEMEQNGWNYFVCTDFDSVLIALQTMNTLS